MTLTALCSALNLAVQRRHIARVTVSPTLSEGLRFLVLRHGGREHDFTASEARAFIYGLRSGLRHAEPDETGPSQ